MGRSNQKAAGSWLAKDDKRSQQWSLESPDSWLPRMLYVIHVPIAVTLDNQAVSQMKKPFTSTVGIHEIP